jgi:hypothetical protein
LGNWYEFAVVDSDGIRVRASGSNFIRFGNNTSITGGYVQSFIAGSTLKLVGIDSNMWMVYSSLGTWDTQTT